MSLEYILDLLKQNIIFAAVILIFLLLMFIIGYIFIYKKLLNGKKQTNNRRIFMLFMFIGYIIVVLGITLLDRGATHQGAVNLAMLSSYREAWYNVSVRSWQNIYLNILMFVPFGLLLPYILKGAKNYIVMFCSALLFTLLIETLQFITNLGVFDLNDMLNNVIGALIGYGIIQAIIKPKVRTKIMYLMPLIIVILVSSLMFTYYQLQTYGNMSIVFIKKIDMDNATITSDIHLNENSTYAAVYKAPSLTKDKADLFAKNFFKQLNLNFQEVEKTVYQNAINYRYNAENSYHLAFNLLEGTYRFTDFSKFDEHVSIVDVEEVTLKEQLERFDILIPEEATFSNQSPELYNWEVSNVKLNDKLINGTLSVESYSDNTIKYIRQSIVEYAYVTDEQLISRSKPFIK